MREITPYRTLKALMQAIVEAVGTTFLAGKEMGKSPPTN
jgi:hypothetical protein